MATKKTKTKSKTQAAARKVRVSMGKLAESDIEQVLSIIANQICDLALNTVRSLTPPGLVNVTLADIGGKLLVGGILVEAERSRDDANEILTRCLMALSKHMKKMGAHVKFEILRK